MEDRSEAREPGLDKFLVDDVGLVEAPLGQGTRVVVDFHDGSGSQDLGGCRQAGKWGDELRRSRSCGGGGLGDGHRCDRCGGRRRSGALGCCDGGLRRGGSRRRGHSGFDLGGFRRHRDRRAPCQQHECGEPSRPVHWPTRHARRVSGSTARADRTRQALANGSRTRSKGLLLDMCSRATAAIRPNIHHTGRLSREGGTLPP